MNHQSVANWFNAAAARAAVAPIPQPPTDENTIVEVDGLFTFVGNKKKRAYLVTQVERQTRCVMSWQVVTARDEAALQAVVNQAARAFPYCTDGFSAYAALNYRGGFHLVAPGKSQTYAVEAGFAEFRRYLARLARRTLFFSRCLEALRRAVALFVQCWNRRQLFKQELPALPTRLCMYLDLDTPLSGGVDTVVRAALPGCR